MKAERELLYLCLQLAEKSREIFESSGDRVNISWLRSELDIIRNAAREIPSVIDRIDSKAALAWSKSSNKRVVWALWKRQKT